MNKNRDFRDFLATWITGFQEKEVTMTSQVRATYLKNELLPYNYKDVVTDV